MAGNKDQRKPSWLSEHPFVNIALWSVTAIVLFILFLLILGGFDFRNPTFESIRTAIDPKHVRHRHAGNHPRHGRFGVEIPG